MVTATYGQIFLYETLGTMMLLLFGCGVVATAILATSKGLGGGWLLINFGWGIGVYAGVYTAFPSGAHLNPAVTVSQLMMGNITPAQSLFYFMGEFLGAFLGAVLTFLAFKLQFDAEEDPGLKLAVFSTGPAVRSVGWNIATEIIGTFVLIFLILISGGTPTQVGDRKSTRLNSSHPSISYAVFCLKKKKNNFHHLIMFTQLFILNTLFICT